FDPAGRRPIFVARPQVEQSRGGEAMTDMIFRLETVYALTGITLLVFAAMTFADRGNPRRVGSGLFWLTLGVIFVAGGAMPYWLTGLLVLFLVTLDGLGRVGRGGAEADPAAESEQARRLGNRIFIPVLLIPIVTFALALLFRGLGMDANRGALLGLGF